MKKQKELSLDDIKAMYAEIAKGFKEAEKRSNATDKRLQEMFEKTNQQFDRAEKMIEKTNQQIGGISRSNGEFCEEYFINSFKEKPTFLGEKFERVVEYLKPEPVVINDEYDLVLRNGKTVVLIEMKYKAGIDDVGKMFPKLHSYRANYPMFKDYKIYLCLASFRFSARVRERAAKDGIVLIQQRGDKIEVISENLKTW
ncbi:MAG: hypothetical protein FWF70_04695 [Bacteroidetes bacterium]|nr:hypothetical protein [Bacteroidota bacterium]MCL1969222.1 hypothetical protein [Bacteroidota bacterium]